MFTIFPELPTELRDSIWREPSFRASSTGDQEVEKPLESCTPAMSATTALEAVTCAATSHSDVRTSAIFINFNIDTVYRQQGGLPNMNRMYNFPGQPIDLLDRFSSSVIIKAYMWWNVQPWIQYLKVLTIPLDVAAKSNHHDPPVPTICCKIFAMCPDLEKLNIVLHGRLDKGAALDQLVRNEIGDQSNAEQQRLKRIVLDDLQKFQADSKLLGLDLGFLEHVSIPAN
ncbi:uncharacterized protein RSE6_00767 [Rhynchosporium secalis]|uniref:Uncharacterized protein n=1 Tax=Rhynchosporium secalis TaxID=38038 RepID=A0A1E1LW31_RHYSE|nr:uncharacterized protein RSE6_00767 [Rhynchosporium secalis]